MITVAVNHALEGVRSADARPMAAFPNSPAAIAGLQNHVADFLLRDGVADLHGMGKLIRMRIRQLRR